MDVANHFNATAIPTPRQRRNRAQPGARWTFRMIRNNLLAPHVGGTVAYSKPARSTRRDARTINRQVEPVLDNDTWRRVKAVLGSTSLGPRAASQQYPLSKGRLLCPACGSHMSGAYNSQRGTRQYRSRKRRKDARAYQSRPNAALPESMPTSSRTWSSRVSPNCSASLNAWPRCTRPTLHRWRQTSPARGRAHR